MQQKDKLLSQLKQNIVYKWSCPKENCNLSYKGESRRYLENTVKESNSHVASAVYKHEISENHSQVKISYFMTIDSKQVAREVIHIRINTALNCNTGKVYTLQIYNHLVSTDRSSNKSNQVVDTDFQKGHTHLSIPKNMFSRAVCLVNEVTSVF